MRIFMIVMALQIALFAKILPQQELFFESYAYSVESKKAIDVSVEKLRDYLKSIHAHMQDFNKSSSETLDLVSIRFSASNDKKEAIKNALEDLGETALVYYQKVDYEDDLTYDRYHKSLLDDLKKEYTDQFKVFEKIDDKDSIRNTIDKIRDVNKRIYDINIEMKQLKKDTTLDHYTVNIRKDKIRKIVKSDVNKTTLEKFLPSSIGVDYAFLQIEKPSSTFSAALYSGYEVKYRFYNDQSVFKVATMNATQTPSSSSAINALFFYSYGQNFYPEHFRDGKSALSYLYSGFTVGGYIATKVDESTLKKIYITPYIGYEIFRNQYIVIDSKLGYFIPFGEQEVQHFRGIQYNLSVSLVL